MRQYFLETKRLALRAVLPKDADIMFDYRNDARCAKYQRGQTKDYDGIVSLIQRRGGDRLFQPENHLMAIADRSTDELVGEVVIMMNAPTITLGYTMSYHHHRKGYAFEVLSALIPALHDRFPDNEVICLVEPENEASIGLLKKLEFEDLGYAEPIASQVFGKWPIPEEV